MMKIIFHDIGDLAYRPRFKCGVGLGVGAAVAGIGSAIIGSSTSSSNVSSQLGAQSMENAKNRDWQTAEAEKARLYNTGERERSQDFAREMLEFQNAYNSPQNQAAMYREAGLNPSLALGGNGAIVSANPSTSSPASSPTPSAVSGLSPVSYQPLDLQIPQLLNSIGGFLKNTGEAENLGVNTDMAKALFDTNIKLKQGELTRQELYNTGLMLDNVIKNSTKDYTILSAEESYKKAVWDAVLSEQQGISEQIQQDVLRSQEALNKALENYHGQNAELLKLQVANYQDIVNMQLKIGNSQVNANNAAAKASESQASLNASQEKINGFIAGIKETEQNFNQATFDTRFRQELGKLSAIELSNIQNDIRNKDLDAYNAFQRILLGKTQKGDAKKIFEVLHDIDRSTALQKAVPK